MKNELWYAPEYYKMFRCKTDKCRRTCCSDWRIPVSKSEYLKLVTMECSDDLNRRIQNTFIIPETVTDACYRYVSFNWLGNCPLQDRGLCKLHREKGEDFLPKVCRLYPRSLKEVNGIRFACCSSSCERVVEMLMEADRIGMEEIEIDGEPQISYTLGEEGMKQIACINDVFNNERLTLKEKIASVCRIVNPEAFEKDSRADEDALAEAVDLLERFSSSNEILAAINEEAIERYRSHPECYEKDRIDFEERYPDWMAFFERLINNSMIYECFPFVDKRSDPTRAYKGLCAVYGLLKIVCVSATEKQPDRQTLTDAVAALFHLIDHTAFYYNISCIIDNTAILLRL